MYNLTDRSIILGVSGSIAAYKAAELASKLTQAGAKVDVLLTPAAARFVAPLTFQGVSGRPAFVDMFDIASGASDATTLPHENEGFRLSVAGKVVEKKARIMGIGRLFESRCS